MNLFSRKIRILFVSLLFSSLFTTQTFAASFLVEPSLGYALKSKLTDEDSSDPTQDFEMKSSPLVYGMRLGMQSFGLMLGLDYRREAKSDYDFKDIFTGATADVKAHKRDIGLFVGYNFPVFWRAWASYYFDSRLTFDSTPDPTDIEHYKGNGFTLGLGYTGFPLISLNLEYSQTKYDSAERADGLEFDFASSNDVKHQNIILSVSLPFRL